MMVREKHRKRSVLMVLVLSLLFYNLSGWGNVDTIQAAEIWIEITDVNGLNSINSDLSANYRLMANIDLGGSNFTPIGSNATPFTGVLDGNSKIISNFTMNDTSTEYKGLFAAIGTTGKVMNLGLEGVNITAGDYAGILAGLNSGTINKCSAKGNITGKTYVGGLIGSNAGTISDSYTMAFVSGKDYIGGLAGSNSGLVERCYSASDVKASIFNNYLQFDGVDDYITIPHHEKYATDTFTLEAWFQWDRVGTKDVQFILGKGLNQFEIHTGGANINGIRFIPVQPLANADSWLDVKNAVQLGWFHVAAVYDFANDQARVYINGVEQNLWVNNVVNVGVTASIPRDTNSLSGNTNAFIIGRRADGSYRFKGKISDVRFWNIARTSEQIKADMNKQLNGNEIGLIGYWKLNEDNGTSAEDSSDSSPTPNNGTLMGGVSRVKETAATYKGGLVGCSTGSVINSYYDATIAGLSDSDKGLPKTTLEMKQSGTYSGWNLTYPWEISSGINNGYPYLESAIITGFHTDNNGSDTPLATIASVPYGSSEEAAKSGLTSAAYAKLSDGSYVPVTISWAFDTAYDGTVAGVKAVTGVVTGPFVGGQTPSNQTGSVAVAADTRSITGYYKENNGTDTALDTTASVVYGTDEATAKAGLSISGYAKLSDGSYVPVTISWAFDATYDGTVPGVKAVTGVVTGSFPGGQIPTNRVGTVTVQAGLVTISGYYTDNTGADTALETTASVAYATEEAAAMAGLSTTGYAKLSDGSYVPVTISWVFDATYDGTVPGVKAVTGVVTGSFPGGQIPTNRVGTVTVQAGIVTISGYYTDNTGTDTALETTASVAYATEEVAAMAGLSTSGYAKLSDGSYVPVTISWVFDTAYDGTIPGVKAVTGTVTGTFIGGQTPTNRMGTVAVQAGIVTISGYYTDNTGADTALETTASVAYATEEAVAKAGLSTSGYAKLSDGSYVAVTISWAFDATYDGSVSGVKEATGTITGSFPGGQIPTNRAGIITVQSPPTPPTPPPTTSPISVVTIAPTPAVEQIKVDVKQGNTDNTVSQITIERITDMKGQKADTVTYQKEKVAETINKLQEEGKNVARIVIPDAEDEVSDTTINIPSNSLDVLAEGEISLQIDTEEAKIDISKETLQSVNDRFDRDMYFNVVPLKEEKQKEEVMERALYEVGVLNGDKQSSFSLIGVPVTIETNMPSAAVDITLPLVGIKIPADAAEKEALFKQIAVYIEHSDGDKELIQGEIVEYKNGVLGIKFRITKFSNFTIVKTDAFIKSAACDITKIAEPNKSVLNGRKITASVASTTASLTVKIIVSRKASWKLYSDKECKKELIEHKLKLKTGTNMVYIKVTAEDGTSCKVYTLAVIRKDPPKKMIILANKYDFSDAFVGGIWAAQVGGEVVRTGVSDKDSKVIVSYIKKNYKKQDCIYIIGLEKAINGDLEKKLNKEGYANVIRVGGEDKFETAKLISDKVKLSDKIKVVLVNGEVEQKDVDKIQSKCALLGYPILLVKTDSLTKYTLEALKDIRVTQIYIVGNETQITAKVEKEIVKEIGLHSSDIIRIRTSKEIKSIK